MSTNNDHVDLWAKGAKLEPGEAIAVPITRGRFPEIPEPQPTPTWRPVIVGGRDMDEAEARAIQTFLGGPRT